MRLWSLHPSLLDSKGLVALWREALLAQKVLLGQTRGYRFHPQLDRFRARKNPVAAISAYLWAVADEAAARGYDFDASKIARRRRRIAPIPVTEGQLKFEFKHLQSKLRVRCASRLGVLRVAGPRAHPLLQVVPGAVEPWEAVRRRRRTD